LVQYKKKTKVQLVVNICGRQITGCYISLVSNFWTLLLSKQQKMSILLHMLTKMSGSGVGCLGLFFDLCLNWNAVPNHSYSQSCPPTDVLIYKMTDQSACALASLDGSQKHPPFSLHTSHLQNFAYFKIH